MLFSNRQLCGLKRSSLRRSAVWNKTFSKAKPVPQVTGTPEALPAVATGIAWLHQQTMTRDEEQVQGCALYAGSFQQGVSCCFAQAKD